MNKMHWRAKQRKWKRTNNDAHWRWIHMAEKDKNISSHKCVTHGYGLYFLYRNTVWWYEIIVIFFIGRRWSYNLLIICGFCRSKSINKGKKFPFWCHTSHRRGLTGSCVCRASSNNSWSLYERMSRQQTSRFIFTSCRHRYRHTPTQNWDK